MMPPTPSSAESNLEWTFPIPRPQAGIFLGNGVQGVMVWGEESICLTVGRAGFWDHRGGEPFLPRATYKELRRVVEAGDASALTGLFSSATRPGELALKPKQYGCGRLEMSFGKDWAPQRGVLSLGEGKLVIEVVHRTDPTRRGHVEIVQARLSEMIRIRWHGDPDLAPCVDAIPAWAAIGGELEKTGIAPPQVWGQGNLEGGFCQTLPEDDALALAWQMVDGDQLFLATALGADPISAAKSLAGGMSWNLERDRSEAWWKQYWSDVPRVRLPDHSLQELYDYGVYRQAGLNPPEGVAATLQGPWMEDTRIPPWSNDYHFNINVQMIYGACLPSNRPDHFIPLWDLLRAWLPSLKKAGEAFFETPGACMLPHAVDDRGQVSDLFWAGTIDHGCLAWTALMAWQHYRFTLDESILMEIAWPLLLGSFVGYRAMLEWHEADRKPGYWSLPVSVSPEFGGSELQSCQGRDASFQLAALHRVFEILPQAAELLGEPIDLAWQEVKEHLPHYTVVELPDREWNTGRKGIGLWEGQALTCSHRHHSHLAGLYPFETLNIEMEEHRDVLLQSLRYWIETGPGRWSGWSLPWASMICSRVGLTDMATWWLRLYEGIYTNVGRGPLHDADIGGFSLLDSGITQTEKFAHPPDHEKCEIIQLDGALGSVSAILEMLVHTSAGVLFILPNLPKGWENAACEGIRAEGAFLVDASWEKGRLSRIRIQSLKGGDLRLRHGWNGCECGRVKNRGQFFEKSCALGEILDLCPSEVFPHGV